MAKKKILIVDDEKDLAETIKFRLESEGYKVSVAHNGKQAFAKLKEELPNLILLDVMMPGIDGFKVLTLLKAERRTSTIPVVMLTCRGESSAIFKAESLGSADYLIKPFEIKELLKVVKDNI